MRRLALVSLVLALALPAAADEAGELAIAREALRDGLWAVARHHAEGVEGEAARLIVLESLEREGKWQAILEALNRWGNPVSDAFVYYRAVALVRTGAVEAARRILDGATLEDGRYQAAIARLRAELAFARGDTAEAFNALAANGGDYESRLMAASFRSRRGERDEADQLWRAVALDTNATERARMTAIVNLQDVELLSRLYGESRSVECRRVVGLRLGALLLAKDAEFARGTNLIRTLVRENPDAEGAAVAFERLIAAHLRRHEPAAAAAAAAAQVEIWPVFARSAVARERRGRALLGLGRQEDALAQFRAAEEVAVTDEERARAVVAAAQALSAAGRTDAALAEYRRVGTAWPKTAAAAAARPVVAAAQLETRGRELYQAYRFAEALQAFAQAAELVPERRDRFRYFTVLCLFGQGKDVEALVMARELAENARDAAVRADATLWLAKYAYNQERWGEAQVGFAAYADRAESAAAAAPALVWAARAAVAAHDYENAIRFVARLSARYPESPELAEALQVQGEALMELSRYDEALAVFTRATAAAGAAEDVQLLAQVSRADALAALGAENPARYTAALEAYRALRQGETLSEGERLRLAFKIAKTLEKLKRPEEAEDEYYTNVILAFRKARERGETFSDDIAAVFARAVFRLAEVYESRGSDFKALNVLELLASSGVEASEEAERRIAKLKRKGRLP